RCSECPCVCHNGRAPTELYPLSLHDALPISDREARRIFQQHAQAFARYRQRSAAANVAVLASDGAAAEGGISANDSGTAASAAVDRKSTRLNSSHVKISYAVFCLKKKKREFT